MEKLGNELDTVAQWRPAAVGRALAEMVATGQLGVDHHGQMVVYDSHGIREIVPREVMNENIATWMSEGAMGYFPFQYPNHPGAPQPE